MTIAAAIQMASGTNLSANLQEAGRLITQAAQADARLVVLPENFALMGMSEHDKVGVREAPGQGPIQDFLAEQARRHGVWLVGGTVPMACADPGKVHAACLVYDDQGRMVGRYDKIHLFDVHLPDNDEHYEESETIEAGNQVVVVETPFGVMGLSVCYDLRFPELYRGLLDRGAEIVVLPAAFTAVTGRAHWEALVRARAIENQVYVVAAAQGGYHVNGRETHGDSMVVDPWGNVLDRLPRGSGVVTGTLDRERQQSIRRSFPSIYHRRLSCSLG
ncbi:carbon-nitrogen hydrolase family protein [Ectothiorhodospira lacustris]|uniref:carbon-nitrogen hydrolase family protein n=1 Tax=Ectothiorhodospira lacustris TaxID=2899127 RepID=UPI003242FE46